MIKFLYLGAQEQREGDLRGRTRSLTNSVGLIETSPT